MNKGKLTLSILAILYFFYCGAHPQDWHFLNNIDLVIHEAGHVIFFSFGNFLYILGGSLFQVLFPAIFVFYFFLRKQYFSASIVLFWVGENIINVSVYASDAIAMNLPLLGGDSSGHDWHNLLSMTNLLMYTPQIGACIYFCGISTLIIAACLAIRFSVILNNEGDEMKKI